MKKFYCVKYLFLWNLKYTRRQTEDVIVQREGGREGRSRKWEDGRCGQERGGQEKGKCKRGRGDVGRQRERRWLMRTTVIAGGWGGAGRDEPGNKKRTTRRKGNEPQVIKKTDDSNCTTTIATITTKTTTTTTTNWTVITNTGGFLSSLCRFHNEKQVRCTATVYHLARVYLHYVPVY